MFVPLLALGLPVTATASILLAAMQSYGIIPGPTLMADQPDLVWTLLASLLIGNTLLLVINLPLAPLWARLLTIPRPQLYAGILFFASLGAYSVNQDPFDLALLLAFGLLGFAIRRFGIPVLPLILGVILGPLMEVKLREALDLSGGDISGLFNERLAIFCLRAHRPGPRRAGRPRAGSAPRPRSSRRRRRSDDRRRRLHPGRVRRGRARPRASRRPGAAAPDWSWSTRPRATPSSTVATSARRGWPSCESRLAGLDVEHEVRQAMGADVAEEMLRVVDDTRAQVLVIGIRHRTPVGKMIMGSVAQQVLLDAPCPVLAVKPPA